MRLQVLANSSHLSQITDSQEQDADTQIKDVQNHSMAENKLNQNTYYLTLTVSSCGGFESHLFKIFLLDLTKRVETEIITEALFVLVQVAEN